MFSVERFDTIGDAWDIESRTDASIPADQFLVNRPSTAR